ncbi:alpha-L-arabinofuranosidase C-terminal domain-containing protein [Chryseobacterium oryzae]|uniref:non-reducing end alpha-L-arabinofuranosidase n=1 Tax=Chryseobacterium oryzae TaxID=2929799 RepID=A0ABY4BJX8_9FLAO|nr:alpha-L-arabinofuranosidase C-terminal domain-containing protein [Chryseobacterium oryzae]UOE39516.1 alpha-L-arabinofuranosidase [Chryseobacterium oryzae]
MASIINKLSIAAFCLNVTFLSAQSGKVKTHVLDLDGKSTNIKIQPTMYGVFFEDINQAADGGVYAELIKNRSFEFNEPLMGWSQPKTQTLSENKDSGYINIISDYQKSNRNYARITVLNDKNYELWNEGFRGIGLKKGEKYDFSFQLENVSGDISAVNAVWLDENGKEILTTSVPLKSKGWNNYEVSITPNSTVQKAKLKLTFSGVGVVNMDMISLFPQDTWKGRKKGLKKDLVQKLADLKPGFVRFPGGCLVEGRTLAERYQWKKTIGNFADREYLINKWNNGFAHRLTPDYYQSFGLGFFEYFQLAEDFGAEALPILSCGMACQFNTGELVPMGELNPYIQDALDLIEFANGSVNSTWGKKRAEMGHPKPFNLKYIGIGNEQWGPDYIKRHLAFEKAIKAKYPDIKIIATSGPSPDGEYFEYGWQELKKHKAELVDEHYYNSPDWFFKNANRYDSYDRKGPKVFAGEYAAQSVKVVSPDNKNNWLTALSEAAFMTGLERNAEVVTMTSYAPLFAHADGWQWTPDLIWFNNLESYGTPNYYVQKLYGNNAGTDLLKITENAKPVSGQSDLFASAVEDKKSKKIIIKIVNAAQENMQVKLKPKSIKLSDSAEQILLTSPDLKSENNFDKEIIKPQSSVLKLKKGDISVDIPANSFVILKFDSL